MGLLDQAIREHLELKRQHGTDPTEVARLEREALGPPVRETQEVLTAAARSAAPPPAASDAPPDERLPAPEAESAASAPRGDSPVQPTAPFDAEQALGDHADANADHAAREEPAPPAAEPIAPAAGEAGSEPTAPAPTEMAPSPGSEDHHGADDVLEETPDFLQETPEHDRLWFEQRPPRDFDFDD